jgi:hypothetical protein
MSTKEDRMKVVKKFTDSPEFVDFSKMLYLKIILDEIKKDPNLWETFSHEKQVELHEIKAEFDKKYGNVKI